MKTVVNELNALIEKREREIIVLKATVSMLTEDKETGVKIKVLAQTEGRRWPIPGVKRGPYKKRGSYQKIKRSFRKKVESPKWDVQIPAVLKSSGRAMTSREIIDIINPGSYSKSKRVLHSRCSAILSIWSKQKKFIVQRDLDGRKTYTLNNE